MSRVPASPVLAAVAATVAVSLAVPATTAYADHNPPPTSVALVGSLQDELGCDSDWAPACSATELELVDGLWQGTFLVPAGQHEWKVALNDTWDESYGVGSGNFPLPLEQATRLTFKYHPETHRVSVVPADAAAPAGPADRALAGDS